MGKRKQRTRRLLHCPQGRKIDGGCSIQIEGSLGAWTGSREDTTQYTAHVKTQRVLSALLPTHPLFPLTLSSVQFRQEERGIRS